MPSLPGNPHSVDSSSSGADARGCLTGVPEGRHWLVAFGYDSLYYPHDVQGSLIVEISLDARPKADTVMQISEEH
jgi:hypothetical protein